jgi:hypothetical protein
MLFCLIGFLFRGQLEDLDDNPGRDKGEEDYED